MCCTSNRHNVLIPEVQIENSGGEKIKEHIKSSQKKKQQKQTAVSQNHKHFLTCRKKKYSLSWQWRRICLCERSVPFRSALIASCNCFFYWLSSPQHFFPLHFHSLVVSHVCVHVCVCVCVCVWDCLTTLTVHVFLESHFQHDRWHIVCLHSLLPFFFFFFFWRNIINAHWNFHPHESARAESLCVHLWIRVWCLYRADTGGKQKQTFLEHLISQWKQMKAASLYSMLQLNINYIQTARFDFIKCSHRRSG